METAISTLSVMPSTKEQVMTFTKKYKDELLTGTHDPLEQLARLKYIEKFIKNILTDDDIDYLMVAELEKYGKEKDIPISGFKMNIQETGVKYFYEDAGDPIWNDLNEKIKELTEKKKEREEFLKNCPAEGFVEPESGVFVTRPGRQSKTKVVVK